VPELRPCGEHRDDISVGGRGDRGTRVTELGVACQRITASHRVVDGHCGPEQTEPVRDQQGSRVAHIVRAGLERDAPDRDPPAAMSPTAFLTNLTAWSARVALTSFIAVSSIIAFRTPRR
jgi:hypothetical protein